MLLGIKSKETLFFRHLGVAIAGLLLVALVWEVNGTWSPDMRLWKAFGGGSFFLLWFALFIGPAARVWAPLQRLVSFRREAGVWFFLIALVHGYLILDGWVRWSVWEFFGYQYIAETEMYMRVEPGFGLANLTGLIALTFALTLAATSFDRAVNFLGVSSWKWLHSFSYVVFYLSAIHVLYFAFIHYTPSLLRAVLGQPTNYPDNPLKFYYLAAFLSVLLVQIIAFILTVRKQRNSGW
jgi:methionine sulfoxide reductase heme-binding subunit